MDRVVLPARLTEQVDIHWFTMDLFLDVDWDLKSISDMPTCQEAPDEGAMLGGSVPWISRVYNHATNVGNGLVKLNSFVIVETTCHFCIDSLFIVEKFAKLPYGLLP